MLFNFILASITIFLCFFFLFLVVFDSIIVIPAEIEKTRVKLARTIPTGAPITVANDAIEMLPVVTDKQLMTCQNSQKKQYIC